MGIAQLLNSKPPGTCILKMGVEKCRGMYKCLCCQVEHNRCEQRTLRFQNKVTSYLAMKIGRRCMAETLLKMRKIWVAETAGMAEMKFQVERQHRPSKQESAHSQTHPTNNYDQWKNRIMEEHGRKSTGRVAWGFYCGRPWTQRWRVVLNSCKLWVVARDSELYPLGVSTHLCNYSSSCSPKGFKVASKIV